VLCDHHWLVSKLLWISSNSCCHPTSCPMGTGVLSLGVKHDRGVMLTTHPYEVRKSYTSSPPPLPHVPPWHVLFFSNSCGHPQTLRRTRRCPLGDPCFKVTCNLLLPSAGYFSRLRTHTSCINKSNISETFLSSSVLIQKRLRHVR
jgi:hypothetical protein